MPYLFTSESVSEGHPDKVADQISDAILDEYLRQDPASKVACETLVTTDFALVAGEIKSKAHVDAEPIIRRVISQIGYNRPEYLFNADTCEVMNRLHEQSPDINQGVERASDEEQGAGDQGMMFGYATRETANYMPLALDLSHRLLEELAKIRKAGHEMTYLRPDAKSQVTIRYADDNTPEGIDTIVVSTQHDEFDESEEKMLARISDDIRHILVPRVKAGLDAETQKLFTDQIVYHINPTGKFVIGGPHGDSGLTGRKIIVDTYGGKGAHGGGAFSGKDSSKVDRSAAYATRHIAKNLVAAGVADQVLVQVAYAIGVAQPVGLYVTTYGTTKAKGPNGQLLTDGEIAEKVNKLFDMRPYAIVQRFGLRNPIFAESAAYGHMGRQPGTKQVTMGNGETRTFETFTWEKLDYVNRIKAEFGL
ncbi:methionine adenosyltransferase [Hymenobacter daecheongensis DSM 21074]|uniref:S-adenosylmethionine synthase n=1 Tax=Hymenobacter daecheongensis DSM 21074 TaxID=1121955 RepID=A0A1M6DIZ2_9BACT|nr:methionine adenosyltransferase [Hymenobacter daecheongensis]SHI73093.1 methionine adenosyltransferase [Hymenobacter daecheongensis DSM 21074]